MKKCIALTSLLILCACGGGSGGTGGVNNGGNIPDAVVPDDAFAVAAASNAKITSMLSRIEIGDNTIARSAVKSGNDKTVYDLSDVVFTAADEDFGMRFKFGVDENGKITEIVPLFMGDGATEMVRQGDTNKFNGQVISGPQGATSDAVFSYNSLGKEIGLTYSDFGFIDVAQQDGPSWNFAFVGGYNGVKDIDSKTIQDDLTFTGRAAGGVVAILDGEGSGKSIDLDGNAKLVFNTASQTSTLTANFTNWYDVEYIKNNGEETINFTGGDKIANSDFKLLSDNNGSVMGVKPTNSVLNYYGDNTPSEAAGLIQFRDCGGASCNGDYNETQEVRMNMAFGVKK